jgi:hypothetical protein
MGYQLQVSWTEYFDTLSTWSFNGFLTQQVVLRARVERPALLIVIRPNVKDAFVNSDDVVESAIRIGNRAVGILRRNIIKSLFAGDVRLDV